MDFDPQPIVHTIANDNALDPPQKVILCNAPNGILTHTGQVTGPTTWEADFVEAFAASLGRRLAPALVGMEAAKLTSRRRPLRRHRCRASPGIYVLGVVSLEV
jgi:hypothetical protein